MQHRDLHPIYDARHYRKTRQRRIITVLCLFICAVCVVTCVILIKDMIWKSKRAAEILSSSAVTSVDILPTVSDISQSTGSSSSSELSTAPTSAPVASGDRQAAFDAMKTSVTSYLDGQSGRYSVYYVNLSTGETFGYKESQPMVAASSIKIAYNTYLYKKAAEGAFSLDEVMTYNAAPYPEGDLETGTGTIQTSPNGSKYSLTDLSGLSITISDNCATNMILRYLGGIDAVNDGYMVPISAVVNYRSAASYEDYKGVAQSGKHRTSAQDLALYAKSLYDLYKATPTAYEPLIKNLETTEYSWGIPAGVGSSVKVAHKVGFNPSYGANNDVGIVFGNEDYVLCVMTESGSDITAQQVIGQVSKLVNDYIVSLYPIA